MAGISRRLAWITAAVLVTATGCGSSSPDASGSDAVSLGSTSTVAPEPWDDTLGPGLVTLRPLIDCASGSDADRSAGQTVLPSLGGDEPCVVGASEGTGDVFERGSALALADESTGQWYVDVRLRAAGVVIWNAMAQHCLDADATCPTGRVAIVLDDVIQSELLVETADTDSAIRIGGDLDDDAARLLASALDRRVAPEPEPERSDADDDTDDTDDGSSDQDAATATATTNPTTSPSTNPSTATTVTTAPPDDMPTDGFLLPAMCGLPAAEWTSDEHPVSEDRGPWATGSRIDGDLTGDGVDEIVWATVCGAGTVAAERSVHVFDSTGMPMATLPVAAAVAETYPDRTVHPIEPLIEDGQVQLEVWIWQSADAACCPSVTFDMAWVWDGTRFVAATDVPDPGAAQPPAGEAPVVTWDGEYRPAPTTGRVVRLGHVGRQVELLQQALDQRGYDVDVDGYFGYGTEGAVRQFQRARSLPVTGIASDDVWDAFGE